MVEAGERLDEHVDTLISILIATGGKDVDGVVGLKVVMTIKVSANKVVDLLLVDLMQVLELVDC